MKTSIQICKYLSENKIQKKFIEYWKLSQLVSLKVCYQKLIKSSGTCQKNWFISDSSFTLMYRMPSSSNITKNKHFARKSLEASSTSRFTHKIHSIRVETFIRFPSHSIRRRIFQRFTLEPRCLPSSLPGRSENISNRRRLMFLNFDFQ